jgi:hypothetical protein
LHLAKQRAIQLFVTTSSQRPETGGRSLLENFPRWATDVRTVLAVLGIVLYAVLRIAYSVFYSNFGLTPDDLGLGYLDLLIQSAVGTVMLLMAIFIVAAVIVAGYVGLWGNVRDSIRMGRNNIRGQQHAGSSESECPPPAKQKDESVRVIQAASVTPQWRDRRGRRGSWMGNVGLSALSVLALVGWFVGRGVLALPLVCMLTLQVVIVGIKLIKRGLTENRARWERGLAAIALATLGLAILFLLGRAQSDAARVQLGYPSSYTVLGFRITTWGAEDATVSWTSNQIAADLRPLAGRCLMYLGQSNGTAFLYLVSTREVYRVPTAVVVVRTQPAVCSRK